MHNPLYIFTREVLDELIITGHRYFIRQSYRRGMVAGIKASFLISHYIEQAKADIHYKALTADRNCFFYDVEDPLHLEKLRQAAAQLPEYRVYTLHLATEIWKVPMMLKGKLKQYVSRLGWQPSRDSGVNANIFSQFGEIYIALKWQSHETKIPLSDIEKL